MSVDAVALPQLPLGGPSESIVKRALFSSKGVTGGHHCVWLQRRASIDSAATSKSAPGGLGQPHLSQPPFSQPNLGLPAFSSLGSAGFNAFLQLQREYPNLEPQQIESIISSAVHTVSSACNVETSFRNLILPPQSPFPKLSASTVPPMKIHPCPALQMDPTRAFIQQGHLYAGGNLPAYGSAGSQGSPSRQDPSIPVNLAFDRRGDSAGSDRTPASMSPMHSPRVRLPNREYARWY